MNRLIRTAGRWGLLGILMLVGHLSTALAAEDYSVIPMDVDPPLVVDGELSDWGNVPNPFDLMGRENVSDGASRWSGPDDLSGRMRLAWRDAGLFIAAEVTDDRISQTLSGRGLWKGDHVSVLMDLTPGVEPGRTGFGEGQVHIGMSPGSLEEDGSGMKPEVVIWSPVDATADGSQIAARRTPKGYLIEAFVPWTCMRTTAPRQYQDINAEVAISDSDAQPPEQETWMTLGTAPWERRRTRLLPFVYGDGNGQAPPPVRSLAVAATATVAPGQSTDLAFTAPEIPAGKDPLLFFTARFDRPRVGGYAARSLRLGVNGKPVEGQRLANRPRSSMTMGGKESVFVAPDGALTVPYTPSGEAFDKHPTYSLLNNVKGCEFEFNLDGLVQAGENALRFTNLVQAGTPGDMTITLEKVEFRLKTHVDRTRTYRPAPTGELPLCEPQREFPQTYADLAHDDGAVRFTVNGEPFEVTGSFSAPDGKLYAGASPSYGFRRVVVPHPEWIEVRDTFTNPSAENVPVMQTYRCAPGVDRLQAVWLAGIRLPSGSGNMAVPEQPSAFLTTVRSGVGLLPLNDAFRVHADQSAGDGAIALADRHFVLKGNGEYTVEWAIVPVPEPDSWRFINASRRLLDVNFPMTVMSAFLDYRPPVTEWTTEQYRHFIERKSANVVSDGLYCARWQGRVPQGLAFHELVKDPKNAQFYRDAHRRVREAFPDGSVAYAIYYHCFIDVMDENAEIYKDCRRLNAAGEQLSYSLPHYRMYVPTLENAFGKAIGAGIDLRLDTLGASAFYWDEYNQSRGDYTYTPGLWDGCSGDIDSRTFTLTRLKAAVHLVSLPFLEHHMTRIRDRGVPAFYNGAPMSRTLSRIKFQAFTETGSISNCHRMLLYTPVALGDHLTERSQQDCYEVMLKALDWGCLYAWYGRPVYPTHKTITEHMFPSTPIELHEGYLIAKERIVTNRSGLFGWGDSSDVTVYVYDREGRATDGSEARKVSRDGKTYAELRLPEGYAAAVVRREP